MAKNNRSKNQKTKENYGKRRNENTYSKKKRPFVVGAEPMYIQHRAESNRKIPCPYFVECGGCQLLDVSYETSLALKQEAMEKLLKDFGKVQPILGMEEPYSYRNKSISTYKEVGKNQYISGMYKNKSHELVSIERCMVQEEQADKIVETIRSLMKSFKMTAYNEENGRGFLRHVLIRIGKKTGQIMVIMVATTSVFPGKKNFIKVMKERHPKISTLILNVNDRDTTMVLGKTDITLYGKGYITDELGGLTFRISPQSFYQINPMQTEVLYEKAMEMAELSGKEKVLDAYSGIGTIGLIAAKRCKEVTGVELNKEAVKDAIRNAKNNGIQNVQFYQKDAGEFMHQMANKRENYDVVFMDPPRSGTTKAFIKAIGTMKPKKVIYISCGPESLARDLKWLEQEGYKVQQIQPVDMFPWTSHVECVTVLYRVDS